MNLTFTFLAREVFALLPIASTDESRYVLNSVLFEWTGRELLLVATDGRRIGVMRSEHANTGPEMGFSFVVGSSHLRQLQAILMASRDEEDMPEYPEGYFGETVIQVSYREDHGKRPEVVFLLFLGGAENVRFSVQPLLDVNYPNWRMVLPRAEDVPAALDAPLGWELLMGWGALTKWFHVTCPSVRLRLCCRHDDPDHVAPCYVEFEEARNFLGIQMTSRSNSKFRGLPDWVQKREAKITTEDSASRPGQESTAEAEREEVVR